MLEIFYSSDRGRGLKCSSPIRRGTVLMSSEPFVYLLSNEQKGIRCDHCFQKQETLLRCSGCKFMRYCDKNCQKGAWAQHKQECAALKQISPKVPPDFVILLGRVLWKLENSLDDNKTEDLVSIMDLESNYDRLTEGQKETLGQFVIILHSYWGLGTLPLQVPDIKAVLELCAKLKNNSFAICDEELQSDIGTGIYLSCSLINHSCVPNCIAVFDRLQLNIRTLRDLKEGEELTISYVEQLAPSYDRQDELQNIYRFKCDCPACHNRIHDGNMLSDFNNEILSINSSKITAVKRFLEDLEKSRKAGDYGEIRDLTSGFIARQVLPLENVYMARIHDFSMDACIQLQKFEEAFTHGAMALKAYRTYLQEVHPLTGLQMMKLGKILLYTRKNGEAIRMLVEALKVLQITHSHKGEVMQELRLLIEQCQLELRSESKKKNSN